MALRGQRAVVVGAGVAGLAAAAAVRPVVDEVVVIDRDALPREPGPRGGVAQSGQMHNLLSRAQMHLDGLAPGFLDGLRAAGCGDASVARDTHVWEFGRWMPMRDVGLRLMSARRPVIDAVLRERVLAGGGVVIRDGVRAVGIVEDAGRVRGVEVDGGFGAGAGTIEADIVVDASGPTGLLAAHVLRTSGLEVRVDTAVADRWYATIEVVPPADRAGADTCWLVFPHRGTRGALASPVGDGRWYVSVSGSSRDRIPRSFDAMVAHAAGMEEPTLGTLLARCRPVAAPTVYRRHTARWTRFDLLEAPPAAAFAVGDAVATLDPLHGQGMSIAAWQASALATRLASGETLDVVTRAHHADAARVVAAAWSIDADVEAVLRDAVGPGVDPGEALAGALEDDAYLHGTYVRVWHLLEPVAALASPDMAERLRAYARHRSAAADVGA